MLDKNIIILISVSLLLTGVGWFFVSDSSSVDGSSHLLYRSTAQRHLYGNPGAPITIVEFSDPQCPFCAKLHVTLTRLVDESDGGIAWEYRHFPLSIHKDAESIALISECVSRAGGNDAFWHYLETIFANQDQLDATYAEAVATDFGLTADTITECQADPALNALVANDVDRAETLGGQGTPHSVIVFPDGSQKPVVGALPYEQWQSLLNRN